MDLASLLSGQALAFFLAFARIGSILVFLPGFGEQFVPVRFRILFAFALSLALYVAVPSNPALATTAAAMIGTLFIEIAIGIWIGLTARILMTSLQFAGYQIGLVSGLSNVFAPDAASFQGGTLISSALVLSGTVLIFVTDFHHIMIDAMLMSYDVFPVGLFMAGDMAQQIVKVAAASIYVGISLAAPFFVMSLLLNLSMGLANRMMPTMPVFFVASPLLIGFSLLVMAISSPVILRGFFAHFSDWFSSFVM